MPVYHFILKPTWNPPLIDRDGEEFPDDAAAYAHAVEVAREMMRHREAKCSSYRLEVRDENLETCFEILFASVDETLESFQVDTRNSIIESAHARASLNDRGNASHLSKLPEVSDRVQQITTKKSSLV